MNTLEVEERVRAATRAAADTVAPDSVPPLRLPSKRPFLLFSAGFSGGFSGGWRASARWLAPAAAAAAVVAIAVVLVIVGRTAGGQPAGHGAVPSSPRPGPVQTGPPISAYVASGRVPKYYLSIEANGTSSSSPSYAVVRATATGQSPGAWTPAFGLTVTAVTAAADDRTFVADVQTWGGRGANQSVEPRTFYMLVLSRTTGQVETVNRLPVSVPAGQLMTGFALSPDGSKLALAVQPGSNKREPDLTEVKVITLATGAVRTWSANGTISIVADDARSLSWTDDERTLAFDWQDEAGPPSVRLLDLTRSGGNLLADSRKAVTLSPTCQQDAIITPDGSTIVCGAIAVVNQTVKPPNEGGVQRGAETEYLEYSVASGKVTRVQGYWTFGRVGVLTVGMLWSNASGSVLIGQIPDSGFGRAGVISGNEFTPLPATFSAGAW